MTPADAHRDALAWFQANWDPNLPLRDWWQRLADSGWGFPTWPERWFGKGLDHAAAKGVSRARREVGAFSAPLGIATMMVAPTLMEVGTPAQQARYLPGIADGTEIWCQLFSEPGAGSDLAGVQTKAVRDGDEWVVNGQKVWTSGGHFARRAILVARTNPDVPKHRGLSFFLVDMEQPGIEPRPLRQMTGDAEFNEVFLTDARVRHEDLVGELGGGWGVALRLLNHERESLDADADSSGIMGDLDLDAPAGSYVGPDGTSLDDGTGPMSLAQGQGAAELLRTLMARSGNRGDAVARLARFIAQDELGDVVSGDGAAVYRGLVVPEHVRADREDERLLVRLLNLFGERAGDLAVLEALPLHDTEVRVAEKHRDRAEPAAVDVEGVEGVVGADEVRRSALLLRFR